MNSAPQSALVFHPSPASLVFSWLLVITVGVFGWWAWKRSGFARWTGWLELLRWVIAVLVAILLNQPEWRVLHQPDTKPVLSVLWDQSHSMDTRDVLKPGAETGKAAQTRAEAVQDLLRAELWAPLRERFDIAMEPFSSTMDPPQDGTDLNDALERAQRQHERLRAVVMLSDGDWNLGKPPLAAATLLRMKNVPVFSIPVGEPNRQPDIELARVDMPAFAVAGKPLRIPLVIHSSLPREQPAEIVLEGAGEELVRKPVVLPPMATFQDYLVWTPREEGDKVLTVRVPAVEAETRLDDNEISTPVVVRKEQLKVLLIESFPRWEYRYLRNALVRDPGVKVSCLLFHPDLAGLGQGPGYLAAFPEDQELVGFDVVFLGDVGAGEGQLTPEQCDRLARLVSQQASGLVFLPGMHGSQFSLLESKLGDLYPVVLDDKQPRGWGSPVPGQFQLTELGNRSLLTKLEDDEDENLHVWESLPGFQWYAPVVRAKAGTEVLASHASESTDFGRVPLIATKTYGAGKVLFMGTDGAWRWREGVEDRYHYRFWGQVARWMAYQRNMAQGERLRLFYSPDRPQVDEVMTLNANVMSAGGEPLQEATVVVQFVSPAGQTDSVRLNPAGAEAWGLFSGQFTPRKSGDYKVILTCSETGEVLETALSVRGGVREKVGEPARPDVMEEISRMTRGLLVAPAEVSRVLDQLRAMPDAEPMELRVRLWAHWGLMALLVTLLGAFWVGRKMTGTI